MKRTVRLLQVSDLHLAQQRLGEDFLTHRLGMQVHLGLPFSLPALNHLVTAAAAAIHALRGAFDALLITGDLAASGTVEDLLAAHAFVAGPPIEARPGRGRRPPVPSLEGVGRERIFLMPGNHDRYRDPMGEAGNDAFDRVFEDYWHEGQGVQTFEVAGCLAIVACDLTLDSEDELPYRERPGKGRAYRDRVERLRQETARLRQERPELGVIWAVHFPPKFLGACRALGRAKRRELRRLELLEEERLVQAARAAGVGYLLCGHTHWAKQYPLDAQGDTVVHCAGTATQKCFLPDGRNSLHLLEIDVEEGRIVRFAPREIAYEPSRERFV